jgi:transposase-like protein
MPASSSAPRRDCEHRGSPHQHGTRAAYVADRCRCTKCRRANTLAARRRTQAIAYERWHPYVSAEETVTHLRRLLSDGLSVAEIAQAADVSVATVRRLLVPGGHSVDPLRLRPATARKLLSVPGPAPSNPGAEVCCKQKPQRGRGPS